MNERGEIMDIGKVLLVGVGGYILYEYLFATPAASTAAVASTPTTSIAPAGAITTTPASPVVVSAVAPGTVSTGNPTVASVETPIGSLTASQLLAAASGDPAVVNGNATAYVWNWYMYELTGVTPFLNLGGAYTSLISAQTYLNAVHNYLNGQPGGLTGLVRGLGEILNLSSLKTPSKIGWGVGDEEFLATVGSGAAGMGILAGARPGSLTMRGLGILEDDAENNAAYIDEQPFIDAWGVDGGLDSTTTDFYLAAGIAVPGVSS
jgi:hypothetical protein